MKRENIGFQRNSQEKGITLVALVITIVILIILATVAINFAFGGDGLIRRAEQASEFYANDTSYTDESLANVAEYLDEVIPFTPQDTPEPETGGKEMEDMTHGVIEIKWLSGTSYNVSETPNAPKIKEDLPSGTTMELVRYTGEGETEQERWIAGTEYRYVAGTGSQDNTSSKWANARVTIDGVDSYFVWIPRYAYRIIYFDSDESKQAYKEGTLTEEDAVANEQIIGYSDSRGIVDAQGKKIDGAASTTKTMVSSDYFMAHPAFTTDIDNGGWSEEIEGIWIGKYETSGSTTELKVEPGVSSLRNKTIGTFYTAGREYADELNSHMLKNSEWGAVAYLIDSEYGRNGHEITINNNGTTYYTGGGTGNTYTTRTEQSSTGNVYGIYDLRGNANEYVASYYNESESSNLTNNGESFASQNGSSNEYSIAYTGTSASTAYKYGDATYETSGWYSDGADFVNSDYPFFIRGGRYDGIENRTGCLCFFRGDRLRRNQHLISIVTGCVNIYNKSNINKAKKNKQKFAKTIDLL